ncbi:MAG: N-acetyltransferase [Hyphomonadaceae bacterium]|nr:N-acetyltransferase [Hyphomonadaceae bacterium]
MFRDNAEAGRFELDLSEGVVYAAYRERNGVRIITHVETPPAARGRGRAGALMDQIVVYAREHAIRVSPVCSYAVAYFERKPDASDVLA